MKFRPCIDLKDGKVVQIVGGSLDLDGSAVTNYQSDNPPSYFAKLYQQDELTGGHVIALGPNNRDAALEALRTYPGGLQYGGGVTIDNADEFLAAGASQVIVTSYVFRDGKMDQDRLEALSAKTTPARLVIDLSCRSRDGHYWVVTDRWSKFTELKLDADTLSSLSRYCSEFLVHGVDVEGKMAGIEDKLVRLLGDASPIPVTYAGGARSLEDLDRVEQLGQGRVDLTIGSALDIFGGQARYVDVVDWHRKRNF